MGFMQIETTHDLWYTIETRHETFLLSAAYTAGYINIPEGEDVDEDSVGPERWAEITACFESFCDPTTIDSIYAKTGWGARYSAPGYMDCTDWVLGDTEEEAIVEAREMWGDEEEQDDDYDANVMTD